MVKLNVRKPFSRPLDRDYRTAVIAAGLALLVWVSLTRPLSLHPGYVLLIALFVAFQINFPLSLLRDQITLIHVVILGSGLLWGAATAGWAAALGVAGGVVLSRFLPARPAGLAARPPLGWLEAGYLIGRQVLALLLALLLSDRLQGFPNKTLAELTVENLLLPALLFAGLHSTLFLGGFVLRKPRAYPNLRRDLIGLALIELLPIPFVLLAVMAYPVVKIGAVAALGGLPVIASVLMHGMSVAREDLERRLQELSTFDQVSQVLRSPLDLENLLSVIHLQVSGLLAVNNFYVALYDATDERIWYPLAVQNGQRQDWEQRTLGDRLTDRVIRERQPLLLNYLSHEPSPEIDLPISEEKLTAWIGVPLISSDRALGCLALFSKAPRAEFSQNDLDLLMALSGQISMGIENALLYEQAQRRAMQLETLNSISRLITASLNPEEVLAQVCRSVSQVSGGKRSAIYLLDPEESEVWLAYTHELSDLFVQRNQSFSIAHNERTRCLRTGRPVLAGDLSDTTIERDFFLSLQEEGIQAFGDFPLVTPEGQIGFLSVYFDSQHTFTAEEGELLQTFASQAALAVSNARLHARTDLALSQRAHQLSILEAVGRELAAAIHSDRLFEMILDYALEFTDSPWGSLGIYNPATQMIELRASSGYIQKVEQYSINEGISGRALRTRQVINCPDVRKDPDFIDLTGGRARSQLSIPLTHEGRVLGQLTLENPEVNGFTPGEQAFISQLANQAAIAVVNAELYSETQRRLREQSTLYLVSTRLAGTLELEQMLQTVQRAIAAALESARVGIYLWDEISQGYLLQPGTAGTPEAAGPSGARLPESIPMEGMDGLADLLLDPAPLHFLTAENTPPALLAGNQGSQVLVLPLAAKQQRLGLVQLYLPEEKTIQDDELQLLRAIAAQGMISLQNALLFSDVTHGRDRLDALLNSVREGIVMIEACGRVTLVNEPVAVISGLRPAELIGKNFASLGEAALRHLGYTQKEAYELSGALGQGQVLVVPKSTFKISEPKPEKVIERSSLPVWGRSGKAVGWMIVLRDVTEEHQIAQARELITETLVHDLRSPLSAVLGAIDVLDDAVHSERPAEITHQALQVARRGATRVLGLIESLLDISRMQSGSMELALDPINVHQLVASVLAELFSQASDFGVILCNEVEPGLPPVLADLGKAQRILINLVDNALKFTPSGGQVVVSAVPISETMLAISISDNGPGIPEEYREKIFDRFTQVPGQRGRRRGSGLGLTFCRLAVEAHGGRIWMEPRPGGGSIFTFSLPMAEPILTNF